MNGCVLEWVAGYGGHEGIGFQSVSWEGGGRGGGVGREGGRERGSGKVGGTDGGACFSPGPDEVPQGEDH